MKNEDIKLIENIKYGDDTFVLRWHMTRICNYDCKFCIQGNKKNKILSSKGESHKLRMEIADKIIEFIENDLNKNFNKLNIFLIGGEVTILPDFIDILKKFINVKFDGNVIIHITTNNSASEETLIKIKDLFNNVEKRYFSYSASFYKDYTTIEQFMDKLKILYSNKRLYHIACIMEKYKLKTLSKKMKKFLKKPPISVSVGYPILNDSDYFNFIKAKKKYKNKVDTINPIIIRKYDTDLSLKFRNKLAKSDKKFIKVTLVNGEKRYFTNTQKLSLVITDKDYFDTSDFICDAGIRNISIDNVGDICRCPTVRSKAIRGNVLKDKIELLDKPEKCQSNRCNCSYYRKIGR